MSKEQDLKDGAKPPWAVKESRADFTYVPLCKPLSDVMCLPDLRNEDEVTVFKKIMDNYFD